MRTYLKLAITALVATAALAALVSTASAGRLSISNQNFRVSYSSLEFAGPTTVRCGVTLEGSFHTRTIAKTIGSLIGYITRVIVRRPCTGGTAWAHNGETNEVLGGTLSQNLPWHVHYNGFGGTLPNISSIRLLLDEALFTIRAPFFGIPILCEFNTTNANGNALGTALREAGGALTTLEPGGRIRSNQEFCPEGQFKAPANDGTITLLGAATRITVTLI